MVFSPVTEVEDVLHDLARFQVEVVDGGLVGSLLNRGIGVEFAERRLRFLGSVVRRDPIQEIRDLVCVLQPGARAPVEDSGRHVALCRVTVFVRGGELVEMVVGPVERIEDPLVQAGEGVVIVDLIVPLDRPGVDEQRRMRADRDAEAVHRRTETAGRSGCVRFVRCH